MKHKRSGSNGGMLLAENDREEKNAGKERFSLYCLAFLTILSYLFKFWVFFEYFSQIL